MPTYFITGASRGIGLEFVKQLITSSSNIVIATARKPAAPLTELQGEGKLHVLSLDVSNKASIAECGKEVAKITDRVDYLLNVAGINFGGDDASTVKAENLTEMFNVNVISQVLTVQALESLFQKGTVIMNMTSGLGSCDDTLHKHGKQSTGYSISKAAVNMLAVKQALHYEDCIVISMDPGWVQTDMGGPNAVLPVGESVKNILKCLHGLKKDDSGYCFLYDGSRVPF